MKTALHDKRHRRERGFAIAPILYLLGLVGVGAAVLFSGYSQILRSNQNMSNTLAAKNDLQGNATTLAATSWLSNDKTMLCPPMVGSNTPSIPSVDCSTSTSAISVGSPFGSAAAANLPANYSAISATGAPVEVGVFRAGSGLKVLDPWGHYYLYCRWENGIGNANALAVISAGPSGKVQTKCGDSAAGGDNLLVVWTTAVTQNRAAVWQTTTAGSAVTGAQFGAVGTQVSIGTNGNVIIPGTLDVSGATTLSSSLTATGITNTPVSGSTGSFTSLAVGNSGQMTTDNSGNVSTTGTLGVSGLSTLGLLSAGSSTMSSAAVTGDVAVGGTLGVTGDTTLGALTAGSSTLASASVTGPTFLGGNLTTATAMVQIGTTVALGSSVPLLVVGKPVGAPAVYPFTVDQNGNVIGGTFSGSFSGNLSGSQSGGSVSATSLSASGATTLSGALTGTSAHFTGTIQADGGIIGNITIGGGGATFTGVLPIANGGTGQATAATALAGLFSGAGTIAGMIPGADLVAGSVTATQLEATGVAAGSYSTVTVGADGRIYSGTASGGTVNTINDGSGDAIGVGTTTGALFTIGSSVQGIWTSTGLMIGSSRTAVNKLDVYGAQAIGTGYAGVYTAPTNGLIVQGNVGIGVSNPGSNALQVNGTVNATSFVGNGSGLTGLGSVQTGSAGQVAYFPGDGSTVVGTSTMYIANGNVGIGTASPTQALSVNGNINAIGSYNGYLTEIPNSSVATQLNKLAKMYGANTVTVGTTGDTDGMIGIVVGSAGTSGSAQIAVGGQAGCVFDSAPSAVGDFVTISASVAGACHDTGSKIRSALGLQTVGQVLNTVPISGSIYPVALAVNGAGGNIQMGMVQAVSNGASCSGTVEGALATDSNGDLLVCDMATPSIAGSSCAGLNPGALTFDETGTLYVCAK